MTQWAFVDLGWPRLWLTNAEHNTASTRVKEKQGARIVDRRPKTYMGGEGIALTWLLERDEWLRRRELNRTSP